MPTKKQIAAIVTAYYPASHADVIVTKFLKGFPTDDGLIPPRVDIASLYIDQIHERDIDVGFLPVLRRGRVAAGQRRNCGENWGGRWGAISIERIHDSCSGVSSENRGEHATANATVKCDSH